STDGADHRSILADEQLGALIAGDGSTHVDDGGERALLAQIAKPHQFLVDVHSMTIITWRELPDLVAHASAMLQRAARGYAHDPPTTRAVAISRNGEPSKGPQSSGSGCRNQFSSRPRRSRFG